MYPINYGDEFPWNEIKEEDEIYMVDFCLQPFDKMSDLIYYKNYNVKLHWIDHHSSAIEEYNKYISEINSYLSISTSLNTQKAACELTWEYLFPDNPVPSAIKLLSLYDSWTYQGHELELMVLPFQIRMRLDNLDPKNEKSFDIWKKLFKYYFTDDSYTILSLVGEGNLILRYDDEQKRRYVNTYGFETNLSIESNINVQNFKAIAVNLGHTNSKIFDSVWNENKYDLMITFVRRSDCKWNVSLYSTKPNINCGSIAKYFNGGGHKGAAGFQCDELPFIY
jgi:oligoribonuclease NrnB/cAMP/cGMP phosphodiesterase (DHH superfamily)